MNTKDIGDITEGIILAELLKSGFTVLLPFGDNNRYDLVVDLDGVFIRIQCKTARLQNGCVSFSNTSVYKGKKGIVKKQYTKNEIDVIMVYSKHYDKIYVIPVGELNQNEMRLRVEKELRKSSNIKWAKDYEFNGRLLER